MRIQWLNPERTKARLFRGWFRKRFADVYRENGEFGGMSVWHYSASRQVVEREWGSLWSAVEYAWQEAKREAIVETDWRPVTQLPEARLVR